MLIIKRDKSVENFKPEKIKNAILKAMKFGIGNINENIAQEISVNIYNVFKDEKTPPTVEQVENLVYYELVKNGFEGVAKAYEGYRAVQEFKRRKNTTDDGIISLLNSTNEDVLKENSNKDGNIAATQRDLIAGEVSKDIARRKLLPTHIVQAHDEGILHYHDMDYAIQNIHNCCLINLEDMFTNGTVINDKLVETPKSFSTACTVATQIMAQVSSNQYGGQSITIKHLAPYLRVSFDKYYKNYLAKCDKELASELAQERMMEELKSGVQTVRYQLSTLQTTNGQSPFATVYLEIIEGDEYENEQALICEEMIKQRLEGMKNYKGQEIGETFPKLIYVLDEHNCLEGGKYDYSATRCNVKSVA
ncbi:anaerobic ribonucleoside-triphosphate reductase [uncultured Clostridium sp.]|uniref:anaerobic ribonucleoside-triphosphate reductase n=1 Tax=uncultured Clostridium sp. TaxID=59620 RepID=UPI00344BEC04